MFVRRASEVVHFFAHFPTKVRNQYVKDTLRHLQSQPRKEKEASKFQVPSAGNKRTKYLQRDYLSSEQIRVEVLFFPNPDNKWQ